MNAIVKRDNILSYINRNNLKKEEFCKICGINTETYENIMYEKAVDSFTLLNMAQALKIDIYFLFNEDYLLAIFIC